MSNSVERLPAASTLGSGGTVIATASIEYFQGQASLRWLFEPEHSASPRFADEAHKEQQHEDAADNKAAGEN